MASSCHHTALEKCATEYQKEPTGRGGPGLRTVAPPSALDELLHLERSCGEGGLSDDAVVATCEKYGPVPMRVPDCRSAADQDEYDDGIAASARAWRAVQREFTIPTATISDTPLWFPGRPSTPRVRWDTTCFTLPARSGLPTYGILLLTPFTCTFVATRCSGSTRCAWETCRKVMLRLFEGSRCMSK